ncbi:TetR/AcrR family transcriptional regulator [Vibrio sp. DW001]|uniref:TetR/AcrR family transcriptional regulator n=1 Tax=Vibrio sp. DW001 TaxID=2912315 RepID=UPI0023B089EB|nr:TetR/AcrR family transcriptional regulator [Vibrio sp. DW001]WED25211.1 TetR/AcrR family transcriptional regulator [Vibrio sp. DW001]
MRYPIEIGIGVLDVNKKQLAAEKMKKTLIEATIEIVGTSGIEKLTTSALSKKANTSKGGLYHHFDSLNTLKISAFQTLVDGFLNLGNDHMQFNSLEEYLSFIGDLTFNAMEQRPVELKALMVFIQQAMFEPEFKKGVTQLTKSSLDRYAEVVSNQFPSLTKSQVSTVVQILDAHFGGSMIHWYLLDDPIQCRENWRSLCKIICFSLHEGKL